MCGIFGYVNINNVNDEAVIKSLAYRGPDASGIYSFELSCNQGILKGRLLHTRLAIIDPTELANQPMIDESGNYVIVYNGEVYNFRELREELKNLGYVFKTKSDTEVILKAYIAWDEKILEKIIGMFSFAILDKKKNQIFIAKDHFGMKPLYYYNQNGKFIFSSTINAIFNATIDNTLSLNREAVNEYMAIGSFCNPNTIIDEVSSLQPGYYLIYKNGCVKVNQYYDHNSKIDVDYENYNDVKKRLKDILFKTVERHLIADVPLGVFLSGGIDSSIIAGIASKIIDKPLRTFTIGFEKSLNYSDETAAAELTARRINSIHENIILKEDDFKNVIDEFIEAIDVPSIDGLNTFIISKAAQKHVKVILSGLGGDEMFAGYPVFRELCSLNNISAIDKYFRYLPKGILYRINKQHLLYYGMDIFDIIVSKRSLSTEITEAKHILKKYYYECNDIIKTVTLFEIKNYLANMLLRDSDAVSMSNSIENRMPFVDKNIFEFVINVPAKFKMHKRINKHLLVDTFSDLLCGVNYYLPKRGFNLPIKMWLKNYLNKNKKKLFFELSKEYRFDYPANPFLQKELDFVKVNDLYKWTILLEWLQKKKNYLNV